MFDYNRRGDRGKEKKRRSDSKEREREREMRERERERERGGLFMCLKSQQLLMVYLMPKFDSFINVGLQS